MSVSRHSFGRRAAQLFTLVAIIAAAAFASAPAGRATPLDDAPDGVLGQPDFTSGGCGYSATQVCGPLGVATDSQGNVFVGDGARVLEFDNPFVTGNAVADRVFGQPDFTTSGCNSGGVSAASLCGAGGVFIDSDDNLWVSDYGNHRVLEYEAPIASDGAADLVLGQPGFNAITNNDSSAVLWYPAGLYVDASRNVWVAQPLDNRVIEFDDVSLDRSPDRVYGQPDFASFSCSAGTAMHLCNPWDVKADGEGSLYISDTAANRVLVYEDPLADVVADRVIGQPNMNTFACAATRSASTLCQPRGLAVEASGSLYVADTGNGRVLRYDGGAPFNPIADAVYGQLGSMTGAQSCSPLSATNLCDPFGIAIDVNGNLWVAQPGTAPMSQRVLVFGAGCAKFADADCDGFTDAAPTKQEGPYNSNINVDNCIGTGNAGQTNSDGNFTNLYPDKTYNDLSSPMSDAVGDACDTDDDNDGRPDTWETSTGCAFASFSNPLLRDTDGDRYLDEVECQAGQSTTDPNKHPALTDCGPAGDSDGDGLNARLEYCFYGTSDANPDSDGDGCSDGKEAASINANPVVDAIDLGQVAQAFGAYAIGAPAFRYDFDYTKNGTIDAIDLGQIAQRFGPC